MKKWKVPMKMMVSVEVAVEAETEDGAIRAAEDKIINNNTLDICLRGSEIASDGQVKEVV